MMVVLYQMPPAAVGSANEWVKKHCVNRLIRYVDCLSNLCFWICVALMEMNENPLQKPIRGDSITAKAKEIMINYYKTKNETISRNYKGVFLDELTDISKELQIMIFVYESKDDSQTLPQYRISNDLSVIDIKHRKKLHILYIESPDRSDAHFLFVIHPEKLTNSKVCPKCHRQWFDSNDKNSDRKLKSHLKSCNGMNKKSTKTIKLEKSMIPFAPHINQNHKQNFTVDFITFDFETTEVLINEHFGKKSELISQLIPVSVAVCVFCNGSIESAKYFSIEDSEQFVDEMIEYSFEKADKFNFNDDNKDRIVNLLGFNSGKFDFHLILPYLQSKSG
jgi:hypothetical protein